MGTQAWIDLQVKLAPAQAPQLDTQLADDGQSSWCGGHLHFPSSQIWPDAHAAPHAPQFAELDCRSTHEPLQRVGVAPLQPLTHWNAPPELAAQVGAGSAHAAPHAPQFVWVDRLVAQPTSAPHWAQPALHAPVASQEPARHCTLPGSTFGSAVQSFVHAPQYRTFVWRSTHSAPQSEALHPGSPAGPLAGPARTSPGVDTSPAPASSVMDTGPPYPEQLRHAASGARRTIADHVRHRFMKASVVQRRCQSQRHLAVGWATSFAESAREAERQGQR